jgi:surfactin synthase thioesterase subunit
MMWLTSSLRRNLGSHIAVRRVQYRLRGWNSPTHDALRDVENALLRMRRDLGLDPSDLVLIGHSMGARVAEFVARRLQTGASNG